MYDKEVRKRLEAMNMFSVIACGNGLLSEHSCGTHESAPLKVSLWGGGMAQPLKARLTSKNV